jgi:hypothetical protein
VTKAELNGLSSMSEVAKIGGNNDDAVVLRELGRSDELAQLHVLGLLFNS